MGLAAFVCCVHGMSTLASFVDADRFALSRKVVRHIAMYFFGHRHAYLHLLEYCVKAHRAGLLAVMELTEELLLSILMSCKFRDGVPWSLIFRRSAFEEGI